MTTAPNFYDLVYAVVRQIPAGHVSSYGRIARMLNRPRAARAVGYALNALKDKPGHDVPWHRVVNSQGRISISNREYSRLLQAERLRGEGVPVDDRLTIVDFERYLWAGPSLAELDMLLGAA